MHQLVLDILAIFIGVYYEYMESRLATMERKGRDDN